MTIPSLTARKRGMGLHLLVMVWCLFQVTLDVMSHCSNNCQKIYVKTIKFLGIPRKELCHFQEILEVVTFLGTMVKPIDTLYYIFSCCWFEWCWEIGAGSKGFPYFIRGLATIFQSLDWKGQEKHPKAGFMESDIWVLCFVSEGERNECPSLSDFFFTLSRVPLSWFLLKGEKVICSRLIQLGEPFLMGT